MTDKELEQWVRNNPWKANVIYPFIIGTAGALFLQYIFIDPFVTGKWT